MKLILLTLMIIGIGVVKGDDTPPPQSPSINGSQIVEDLLSIPPKRFLILAGVLPQPISRFVVIVSGLTDTSSPRNITGAVLFNQSLASMIAPTSYNLQEEFSSSNNKSSILDNSGVLLSSVYPDLVKGYDHEPMAMLCLEDSSNSNTNCLLFLQRGTEKMLIFDLLAPSKPVITCELKIGSKGWDRIAGYLPLTSDTPNEYFAYQAFIEDDQENEKFNNSLSLTKMVGDFKTIDNDLCFASEKGHQQTTFRNLCKLTKADNEPNRTSSSSSTTSTTTTSTTASTPPKDLKFSFEEGDRKCPNRGLKNGSLFGYDPLSGFINGDALYLLLLDGRIFSLPKVGYVYTGDLMTMTLIDPPSTFWRAWKPANRSVPMPPPRPPTTPPTKEPVTGNSSSKAKSSTTAKSDRLVLYIAGGVLILLLLIALAVLIWYCLAAKSTSGAGEKQSKKKDRGDGESKNKKKKGGGETSTSSVSGASASTSKPAGKGSKVAPSKVSGAGSSSVVASSYAPSKSTSAAPASSSAIQPKNSSAAASKVKIPSSAKLSKQSSAVGVAGGSSSIAASSVSSAFASKASKAPKLIKGGGGGGGGKSSSMASSSSTGAAVPSRPAASKVNSKK